ncbi:MAG: RNA recognition motif domain-containing protein [bacterium]
MRIYVGNLSCDVTSTDLLELFKSFGDVASANVVRDKYSGESREFGFVEMSDKGEGENSIKELDGQELKGRRIKVSEARPRRQDRFAGGSRGGGSGGGGFRRY